jgi:hypothetical protein
MKIYRAKSGGYTSFKYDADAPETWDILPFDELDSTCSDAPVVIGSHLDNFRYHDLGWIPILEKLQNDIDDILQAQPDSGFAVLQLKEKFGAIRLYFDATPDVTDAIRELARSAAALSEKTCHSCGAPATLRSTGWILPYCADCATKEQEEYRKHVELEAPRLYSWLMAGRTAKEYKMSFRDHYRPINRI